MFRHASGLLREMTDANMPVKSIVFTARPVQIGPIHRARPPRSAMLLPRLLPLVLTLTLAGCLPVEVYHKSGVPISKLRSDDLDCAVSALAKVPVTTVTRTIAGYYVPGRKVCSPAGCYRTAGYMTPPRIEQYDSSAPLRAKVAAQCMQNRGYRAVELKRCASSGPITVPSRQPDLSASSCAVKVQDRWEVVTP